MASPFRVDGVTILRVVLGAWLAVAPWVLGDRFAPQGICDLVLGAITVALAAGALRWPTVRIGFVPLALALVFTPFVVGNGSLAAMYSDILVGKTLLISAAATAEMFKN